MATLKARTPVPVPIRPPSLLGGWLALAFFAVVVPGVMLRNAASEVSPGQLEARCRAAYAASASPQYAVNGYTFSYPKRFGRTSSVSWTRMTVRDMTDPALSWDERPRTRLRCRLGALRRLQLQPWPN